MLYDQVAAVIDRTTELAQKEAQSNYEQAFSQEGLLSAFAGKEGGAAMRLGEKVLRRSGNLELSLKKAFDAAFSRAEKKVVIAGKEGLSGVPAHIEKEMQTILKWKTEENPMPYYRTALRMALNNNELTGKELKELVKLTKEKIPGLFVPYETKSFARKISINTVSDYDRAQVYLKTNFSESRLEQMIAAREKFRAERLDGFAPISVTRDTPEVVKSGVSMGTAVAGLAIAATVLVGVKTLLSSVPKAGGESAVSGYRTKVENWIKSIRIPNTKLSVGKTGDLLVNGVSRSEAGGLGSHLGDTTKTVPVSKMAQLLNSVKSGFSAIPDLLSKAGSAIYKTATSGSTIMRLGKAVAVSTALIALIASVLFFIVIGAVRLVPNIKDHT